MGIDPFEPRKVLERVSLPSTPPPQTRFITPPATTPFTDAVLTRSPIDMNAVRFANSVLNDLIANSNGIRSGQYPTRDSIRPGSSVPSSISVTAMSEPT